jgi:hypothetical protein
VDNYIDIIASGIFLRECGIWQKRKLDPLDYWGYNSNAFVCLSRTWDVIITIFNFTILAISAYIEWRKILRAICNYKIAMFGPESTGKQL